MQEAILRLHAKDPRALSYQGLPEAHNFIGPPFEGVSLSQNTLFRIRYLVEIGHRHRTPLINGFEGGNARLISMLPM